MQDVKILLYDGEMLCAPIWDWKPVEGWLSLVGEPERKIYFKDIQWGFQPNARISMFGTKDVNLLERAQNEGWQVYSNPTFGCCQYSAQRDYDDYECSASTPSPLHLLCDEHWEFAVITDPRYPKLK